MRKKLELAIKILIGVSFFVPLAVFPSSFIFPFVVPKILLFRSLALLASLGYLLLLFGAWQDYKPKLTPVNIAVGVFFLSFAISTFVGVDWYRSMWDNHERMLGLFTISHFLLYYLAVTSVVRGWKDWKWFLRIFLLAGCLVMILGVAQKIDPEFLLNHGSNRVSATLGNAIYFSGYGFFLFFVGLLLFLKEKSKIWKCYATIGGVLGFLGVFWGGTRGTLVGLMVSFFVLFLCYLVALREHKKTKIIIVSFGIVCAMVFCGLIAFRHSNFVSRIPVVGQLFTLNKSDLLTGTIGTRLFAWSIAVDGWKERPVFGWGPNNYYYAFNKYYNPKFLEHGWGETWFDNAHSAIMNTLSVQGIFGFLSYVGVFFVPIYALWRGYKRHAVDAHVLAIGAAFLAGHFVHNIFVFENPTSYLYFFFFLAFINQLSEKRAEDAIKKEGYSFSFGLAIILSLVVILFIYVTDVNPARANVATLNAIRNLYSGPALGVAAYDKAIAIPSPHVDDIRNDFSRTTTEIISILIRNKKTNDVKMLFEKAFSELQKNRSLHPLDIRVNLQQAQLALTMAQETGDVKLFLAAESALEEALSYSPRRQQIQYMLSMVKLQLGKNGEAISILQSSIDNNSKIGEGWWRLAFVYEQIGDDKKAKEVITTAQNKGVQFDAQGNSVISMILAADKTSK